MMFTLRSRNEFIIFTYSFRILMCHSSRDLQVGSVTGKFTYFPSRRIVCDPLTTCQSLVHTYKTVFPLYQMQDFDWGEMKEFLLESYVVTIKKNRYVLSREVVDMVSRKWRFAFDHWNYPIPGGEFDSREAVVGGRPGRAVRDVDIEVAWCSDFRRDPVAFPGRGNRATSHIFRNVGCTSCWEGQHSWISPWRTGWTRTPRA